MSSRVKQKAAARERAAQILAAQKRSERRRRLLLAGGSFVVVILVIAGLVVLRLNQSPSKTKASGEASGSILKDLKVPASTLDSVGTGGASGGPAKIKAPALTSSGKPRILYVGAEYCPYCAAERWAISVALSRFGTFTKLGTTHSSSSDVFPNTPTLSFHDSAYSSSYLAFTGVETTSNKKTATGYADLDKLAAADQKIFDTYNAPPYVKQGGSIPFVDIGGTYVSSGATYSPQLLAGKTHAQVAAALKNPSSAIAKAIDGSANLFTAAICDATGGKPANVCTSAGVTAAAAKIQ